MKPRYRMPDNVGYVVTGADSEEAPPSAYLAVLPTGPIHWLDPAGHLIWSAAVDLGEEAEVIAEIVQLTGEDPDRVGPDVAAFLGELVAMGLLEAGAAS